MASVRIIVNYSCSWEEEPVRFWFEKWKQKIHASEVWLDIPFDSETHHHAWDIVGPVEALRELPVGVIAAPGIQE